MKFAYRHYTSGPDRPSEKVLKLLRGLADAGTSVLMVTHEKEAEKYADHIYKMRKGVLTEEK